MIKERTADIGTKYSHLLGLESFIFRVTCIESFAFRSYTEFSLDVSEYREISPYASSEKGAHRTGEQTMPVEVVGKG